jgi:oligopeptide transport system permease protein
MSFATIGVTVPNFVVGPVLTLIFAVMLSLGFLPEAGAMARFRFLHPARRLRLPCRSLRSLRA